jgi:uncharacterized membrane protein YccC
MMHFAIYTLGKTVMYTIAVHLVGSAATCTHLSSAAVRVIQQNRHGLVLLVVLLLVLTLVVPNGPGLLLLLLLLLLVVVAVHCMQHLSWPYHAAAAADYCDAWCMRVQSQIQ